MAPLLTRRYTESDSSFSRWIGEGVIVMLAYNLVLRAYKWRFGFEVYPFLEKLEGLPFIYFNLFVVVWPIWTGILLRIFFFSCKSKKD